ncbi:MAG: transporter substrate-binding domain-containing protein [Porphyromonas sp.]|nr:transporter substrate-binding domain-containing protein [Porphyromonas sp.]
MEPGNHSKRRLLVNGIAILCAALLMWFFTSRRHRVADSQPMPDKITVAVDFSPNGLRVDSVGQLSGVPVQLLDLILGEAQYTIKPYTDRTEALDDLRGGKVQLYASSVPYPAVAEYSGVSATEWLYTSKFSLLYRDDQLHWEQLLSGEEEVPVYVSKDDRSAITVLEHLAELNYPAIRVVESDDTPSELAIKLSKGDIAFMMCDSVIAAWISERLEHIAVSNDVGQEVRQVWLVGAENEDLRSAVDSAIINNRGSEVWHNIISDIRK